MLPESRKFFPSGIFFFRFKANFCVTLRNIRPGFAHTCILEGLPSTRIITHDRKVVISRSSKYSSHRAPLLFFEQCLGRKPEVEVQEIRETIWTGILTLRVLETATLPRIISFLTILIIKVPMQQYLQVYSVNSYLQLEGSFLFVCLFFSTRFTEVSILVSLVSFAFGFKKELDPFVAPDHIVS